MSTIKVNSIKNTSTDDGGIAIDNSGHVQIDGQQLPTAGALSNRNLVINGGFDVAQRSASRVKGNSYNALDRWATGQFQDAGHEQVSVSDSTVPTVKGIRVTSSSTSEAASGTRMALGQMIESVNCVHLAGKKVTLSFYIRFSSATFTSFGDFQYYLNEFDTTADQNFGTTGATRSNGTTLTNGSLPTTWTKYTKTITCGSAMKNLASRFLFNDLANTTNNSDLWYEVSAVQVEEGEKATPFEHRGFGDELARCQRYCHKYGGDASSSSQYSRFPVGVNTGTTQHTVGLPHPVSMRTCTKAISTSVAGVQIYSPGGNIDNSSPTFSINGDAQSFDVGYILISGFSGLTNDIVAAARVNNDSDFYIIFDAEL